MLSRPFATWLTIEIEEVVHAMLALNCPRNSKLLVFAEEELRRRRFEDAA